ncbi:ABC transporter permease [Actinomadura darangshiensis]|uniref:ABC transporter permease n=1 Tax=Actinomadura darangshiensis TaxID=705336 RepID=A0A4R5BGE8_9ACTN|nr:ABC transporter permease [Actinomadura darangshiensis]TDD84755.1 ABC transporter permease [Actinomadura darangshiensis]
MIVHYIRLEMLRLLRDPGYLVLSLVSPLTMYLVFTNLDLTGESGHQGAAAYAMVGMAGFGAVGAVMGNGVAIAEDKPLGWIRQLRLLPLRPFEVVVGRTLTAMVGTVPPIVSVCLAGALVNDVSLSAAQWASVLVLLFVGIAPMAVLGIGVGYLLTGQQAQMAGLVCYMGLSLLGGLWVPIAKFPGWLEHVATATPINRYGELSWRVTDGNAPTVTGVLVLAGWAAVFAAFAVYGYRCSSRTV